MFLNIKMMRCLFKFCMAIIDAKVVREVIARSYIVTLYSGSGPIHARVPIQAHPQFS